MILHGSIVLSYLEVLYGPTWKYCMIQVEVLYDPTWKFLSNVPNCFRTSICSMAASILACAAPNEHDAETQCYAINAAIIIYMRDYLAKPGIVALKLYLLKQLILK